MVVNTKIKTKAGVGFWLSQCYRPALLACSLAFLLFDSFEVRDEETFLGE